MTNELINMESIINEVKTGTLCLLGKGSSRKCYDIGNGYVAKVAFTDAGIAQNQVECSLSGKDELLNPVLGCSEDFAVVIYRKAQQTRMSEVQKALELNQSELLCEISRRLSRYHLCLPDLIRADSWGIVDSKPVLVDYGYTVAIWEKYYQEEDDE